MALDVAWTDVFEPDGVRTRDGGDPLGFRAYANRLAHVIAPGLTQATSMTRGFGLLCLALDVATGKDPVTEAAVRERFLRVERIWVAAEALRTNGAGRFPGKRRAWRLAAGVDDYPVSRPILDQQLSSGAWGAYRRSAAAFGLIDGAGGRAVLLSRTSLQVTGRQLAAAMRTSAGGGVQFGHWAAENRASVPISVLGQVAGDSRPTKHEVSLLSQGIAVYDERHDRALTRLRAAFKQQGGLSLATVDVATLAPQQARAVVVARSLVKVIEEVEWPFRRWVATGKRSPIPNSALSLPIWNAAADDGEGDLMHLRDLVRSRPAKGRLDAVLDHHRWLARARGAPEWKPGDGREAAFVEEVPTFTLGAAASLFGEGVAPHAGA